MTHRIRARDPRGPVQPPERLDEPGALEPYLSDASRYPGGRARCLYLPRSEGEVAWAVRNEPRLLAVGAQSSLTGGATPAGDALLGTARMDRILSLEGDRVRVEPGLPLLVLLEQLEPLGAFYPPVPTFTGAYVGGTVSTNAAGAATWKYGSTRQWVEGLTVVLASGHVLELRRGEVRASAAGRFEVELPGGEVLEVPVPPYTMPDVPKRSAGYHAEPGMDLVDLFVGSEGTLGVITEVELRLLRPAPQLLVALIPAPSEARGVALVDRLRRASRATWAGRDPAGLDVRAIESMDRRCLELLREDEADRKHAVRLPDTAELALIVQLELPPGVDAAADLEAWGAGERPASAVTALLDLLSGEELLDECELALPGDRARQAQLFAIREAVPVGVNHRVEQAKRSDPRIHKVGGDLIVPFERFGEMLERYRQAYRSRGLDYAIWGHISDGNVHPNVIPRSYQDVERAHEALLELGREVTRLGGCPLSEHGVGRNPFKQALLRDLYGAEGIEAMRRTRRALDPAGKLAPGVLFPD